MMNVSQDVAGKVIDTMKATPFVLALLIINTVVLGGFAFSMHEISNAAARRDNLLAQCMDKKP
jgi:hypothetical protein